MTDNSDADKIKEYNERISKVPGIFGEHTSEKYLLDDEGNLRDPGEQTAVGAYYADQGDDRREEELAREEERENEDEDSHEVEVAGPAHAAELSALDASDGTTQSSAPVTESPQYGVESSHADFGDSESSDREEEGQDDEEKKKKNKTNASDQIRSIKEASTVEEVDRISEDDSRSSVRHAANKRKEELS